MAEFGINTHMQIHEVVIKPKTPEQQRVAALKATKDKAADALKAERARQKVQKAQQTMAKARRSMAPSSSNQTLQ
jgi:transcriptional regulator